MVCLKPRTWLNDEIVNFYMAMLDERDKKLCNTHNSSRR
jgi:Ulp1 family protease